jgi:hypothetical protein
MGKKCGRRERESRREGRREQSFRDAYQGNPSRVVMVKGILVAWKAALFAGRRPNGGLGSVRSRKWVLHVRRRAGDTGCPLGAEEGNVVGIRSKKACATRAGTSNRRRRRGDASFTRSRDPCTSILTMLRGASLGGGAFEVASRLGKLGVTREEPALGPRRTGGARLAAGHRSRKRSSVVGKRRKGIMVPVPARNESRGLVARTSK